MPRQSQQSGSETKYFPSEISTIMRKLLMTIVCGLVLISAPSLLSAQNSSSLTGVVTDPTGALITGATVTLENPTMGITLAQTNDSRGSYRFVSVPPGSGYIVTFTQSGFSKATYSQVVMSVGVTRTQDAKLLPGHVETIEVSAGDSTVTLNTTDATVGNNIAIE